MSAEKARGEMDAYESAIAKATLLIAFSTPEQRADLARRFPQQMGEVAAVLTEILSPEELEQLSLKTNTSSELPQPTPQKVSGTGSTRFSFIRRFAAKTPVIRRFFRS